MPYTLLYNVRFPIYVVIYMTLYECKFSICEHICAEKFNIYLPCDIYVSIYVNIHGLKKSTFFVSCHTCYYIGLMIVCPYILSHILTYMNVSFLYVSIYVLKNSTYICLVTYMWTYMGSKIPHYICLVSYMLECNGYIKSILIDMR